MRGNSTLVFADSFSVLRGKNRTGDNDYHSLFYRGLPCPRFKVFPYAPVELRALRRDIGHIKTVTHSLFWICHVSGRGEMSAVKARPCVIWCNGTASGDCRISPERIIAAFGVFCQNLIFTDNIDYPGGLFVLLNVSESVSGSFNYGICFAGDSVSKVTALWGLSIQAKR